LRFFYHRAHFVRIVLERESVVFWLKPGVALLALETGIAVRAKPPELSRRRVNPVAVICDDDKKKLAAASWTEKQRLHLPLD
jgi:hypothetical protein